MIFLPGIAFSQSSATAYASARIVEGFHAVPKTQSSFELKKNENTHIDLGKIMLNTASHPTCNIIMSFEELTGINGSRAGITGSAQAHHAPETNGSIQLQATAGKEIFKKQDKLYTSRYRVTLAYN